MVILIDMIKIIIMFIMKMTDENGKNGNIIKTEIKFLIKLVIEIGKNGSIMKDDN
jgi:hypothetical protein